MPRAQPGQRFGGRTKGTPNKVTKQLKDMVLGALDDAGGQRYLELQAKKNPQAFLTLVGKVLPTTITGDVPVAITLNLGIKRDGNSDLV